MNKFRGVRSFLLLGLLLGLGSQVAAAASSPAPAAKGLHAASISAAPAHGLDPEQWCILDLARDFGARIRMPETMQTIVLAESSGGRFLENPSDPSYGVAGVKLDTAEDMLGHPVTIEQLRDDPVLDLAAGSLFLQRCTKAFKAWRRQVVCYNRGIDGTTALTDAEISQDFYFLTIQGRLRELRAYRRYPSKCGRD